MTRIWGALLLLVPAIAWGQSCPTNGGSSADSLWTASLGAGPASAPTTDSQFDPGPSPTSTMYLFKGNSLYFLNNPSPAGNSGQAVTAAGVATGFNQSINNNMAIPVPLRGSVNTLSVFVGGNDGYVYRYDVTRDKTTGAISFPNGTGGTPVNVAYTWRTYVGRVDAHGAVLCPGNDSVTAAPVVQLYAYSDATFQSTFNDDMVYVITRYSGAVGTSCAATTTNRVYALKASTGAIYSTSKWPINMGGTILMDYGAETCTLHYGADDADPLNNTLYCGTTLSASAPAYQHSVHAFNTITGVKQWGANIGAVVTRPQFRSGTNRLYALNQAGALYALDAANLGAAIWPGGSVQATVGGGLGTKNPWAEPRLTGGLSSLIMVVGVGGTDNQLHAIVDNGATASITWNTNFAASVTSMPAISNLMGKVYVGLSDSTVHQLDITKIVGGHPNDDAHAVLGGAGGTTYDIGLDVVGSTATDINALNVANGSNLRRFCVPWLVSDVGTSKAPGPQPQTAPPPCVSDGDCTAFGSVCSTGKCTNGVCHAVPANEGGTCNDNISCTSPDVCRSGQCSGTPTGSCPGLYATCDPITNPCQGTYLCCNNKCIDAQTDNNNCGGCGNACLTGWTQGVANQRGPAQNCQAGTCQRNPNAFCSFPTTAADLNGANNWRFNGAQDFTYTNYRHDAGSEVCTAYVLDGNYANTHGYVVGLGPVPRLTTIDYTNGAGTCVCGSSYTRIASTPVNKTFADPTGGQAGNVTTIRVKITGENDACVPSKFQLILNPGSNQVVLGTVSTTADCKCGECFTIGDVTYQNAGGVPGYIYGSGAQNTLQIVALQGAIDVTSVTVYTNAMAYNDIVWNASANGYPSGACDYSNFWYNNVDVCGSNGLYMTVTNPTTEVLPTGSSCSKTCPGGKGSVTFNGKYCDHTITAALPANMTTVQNQATFDSLGSSESGDTFTSCNTNNDCQASYPGYVCAPNVVTRTINSTNVCTAASAFEPFNQGTTGPTIDYRQACDQSGYTCGVNLRVGGQLDFWFWQANWAASGDLVSFHHDCSTAQCKITFGGYMPGWPKNGSNVADFCPSVGQGSCTTNAQCTSAYGANYYCDATRGNKCYPDIYIGSGGQWVSALSFAPTDNGNSQPIEWLLIAEGTRLFGYDVNATKYNRCHIAYYTDLAKSLTVDTTKGQAAPIMITKMSTDPFYNDFYLDFRDANFNYETAVVKNSDLSVHSLPIIERDIGLPNPIPYYFTNEGVTTPRSGAILTRMNGIGPNATPTFSNYSILP